MRLLVTGGATREPIDRVRFITNFSTGRSAAELCDSFRKAGHDVFHLRGQGAERAAAPTEAMGFEDFRDLDLKMQGLLSDPAARPFDAVIHLAAVADYSVERINGMPLGPELPEKIDSGAPELSLTLTRNHKIVDRLKTYARAPVRVVAFKLTDTPDAGLRRAAIAGLAASAGVDWVVHNDFSQLSVRAEREFGIYPRGYEAGPPRALARGTGDLAGKLIAYLEEDR